MIRKELIENYLSANNLSKTKFCEQCKISPSTFYRIMSGNKNIGIIAIVKVARRINVRISELIN